MQATSHILMIKPVNFGFNAETAANNYFQKPLAGDHQVTALHEFSVFTELLRSNHINLEIVEDSFTPFTPDAIFPNNWISFDKDGKLFLYPMFAQNRRAERKQSVLNAIHKSFIVNEVIDLTEHEKYNLYLEGTGSMVLDRENKIVYACISPRTNPELVQEFCKITGYTACIFRAKDINGLDIYHTNVLMTVADKYTVVCLEAIDNPDERLNLQNSISLTKKEIISITPEQVLQFAGNMLQVRNNNDEAILVMSTAAYNSLSREQLDTLKRYNKIIHSDLSTIEAIGGGSARCMMAEIFLPHKKSHN